MSAAVGLQRRPVVPNAVLAMALFLFTEVMLFAGLLSAYLVLRGRAPVWPPFGQPRLPVLVTLANTGVLLASGWAVRAAGERFDAQDIPKAARALRLALALGAVFVLVQGAEWAALVAHGLTATQSPYGSTFAVLVGGHALHVIVAVAALAWGARELSRGELRRSGLTALSMYWTFVVALWPVLYVLVYLW
jgi:cytochrome c oxidase subunit 3